MPNWRNEYRRCDSWPGRVSTPTTSPILLFTTLQACRSLRSREVYGWKEASDKPLGIPTPRWLQNRTATALKDVTRIRRLKDAMRLERELKQAQIDAGYAQHWAMLT
jgi:hypothetical protein